jgi:hypothetical protein
MTADRRRPTAVNFPTFDSVLIRNVRVVKFVSMQGIRGQWKKESHEYTNNKF